MNKEMNRGLLKQSNFIHEKIEFIVLMRLRAHHLIVELTKPSAHIVLPCCWIGLTNDERLLLFYLSVRYVRMTVCKTAFLTSSVTTSVTSVVRVVMVLLSCQAGEGEKSFVNSLTSECCYSQQTSHPNVCEGGASATHRNKCSTLSLLCFHHWGHISTTFPLPLLYFWG